MLQKNLNNPIVIGACVALITISFVMFLPMIFSGQEIRYCNHDPNMGPTCEDTNAWMGYIMSLMMIIGFYGMPITLGSILAIRHRRQRLSTQQWIKSLTVAVLAWVILIVVAEILMLEPWRQWSTPNGETYNSYSLDAIYGTLFMIPLIFFVLLSYLITYIVSAGRKQHFEKSALHKRPENNQKLSFPPHDR